MANTPDTNIQTRVADRHRPAPCSVSADWFTIITAGGLDDADSGLTDPGAETAADHIIATVEGQGSHLLVRAGYVDGASVTTSPVVIAFGQDAKGAWERLQLHDGNYEATLTVVTASDVKDGTLQYTDNDIKAGTTVYDLAGCQKVKLMVKTAISTNANDALAIVQGKVLN